jgi:tRNA pseudouridine55 synthase
LSKKETYRYKHADKIGAIDKPVQLFVNISEEKKKEFEEGKVLLIDKPLHWTSFDVVRKIRGIIRTKKVGHAGTLDPLATGLLIICTGKFTKQINDFMAQQKEYTGTFTLGFTTPTYDLESTPENGKDISLITEQKLHDATKSFVGNIMQMPPIYSAIKKDGVALYELARRGEEVDLKARPITIHQFEITKIELPIVHFKILCSTGTYIRSIAHDYGILLGCGAYLSSLRRTKIGEFEVEKAMSVEEFMNSLVSVEL